MRHGATRLSERSESKHAAALAALGPHTTGVGCLYIKDLEKVDLDALRPILQDVVSWTESGGDEYAQITVLN